MDPVTHKLGLWNIRIGSMAAVVGYGMLVIFWKSIPPQIPLWYSKPWGLAQLEAPVWLFVIPTLSTGVTAATAMLQGFVVKNEPVLAAIMATTSMVIALLGVFGLLRILLLVL
jgi:hypothetical protein